MCTIWQPCSRPRKLDFWLEIVEKRVDSYYNWKAGGSSEAELMTRKQGCQIVVGADYQYYTKWLYNMYTKRP
jgi:hypothetical protein